MHNYTTTASYIPANIGEDCFFGEGVVFYSPHGVTIGKKVHIGPNCVIYGNVIIGDNVCIGANTTIGGPGFAFDRKQKPMPREEFNGDVIIENNVEIGNNCNIDRGRVRTIIKYGARIDSCCHIAHDCSIGEHVTLAAGSILGGHAEICNNARVGLNATLRNRSFVGDGAVVGMHTPVINKVLTKKTIWES